MGKQNEEEKSKQNENTSKTDIETLIEKVKLKLLKEEEKKKIREKNLDDSKR